MKTALKFPALLMFLTVLGCSGSGTSPSVANGQLAMASYPSSSSGNNLRINLTDKPLDGVSEVHVNIDHLEILLQGTNGKTARVAFAQGFGDVDLLKLRNGVLLPTADLHLPASVQVRGLNLVLKDTDNYLIKDGSRCDMKTPSGQQSGVKLILNSNVTIDANFNYSMVVDFDVEHSIVLQGNGGCLLKPVIKMPCFTRVNTESSASNSTGSTSDSSSGSEPLVDGSDSSTNTVSTAGSTTTDTASGTITLADGTVIDITTIPAYLLQ